MDIRTLLKYTTIVVSLPEDAAGEVMFTVTVKVKLQLLKMVRHTLFLFDLDEGVHTVHAVYG